MQFFSKVCVMGAALALRLALGGTQAHASASVELEWDPPADNADGSALTDLAGYKVYYGTQSGIYTQSVDAGNATSAALSGLQWGTTYFSAVKAYNADGIESGFSEEVQWQSPMPPSVVQQPQCLTVAALGSAFLTARVAGTGPIDYQWRRNGQPVPGSCRPDCLLRICVPTDNGAEYDLVASNPYGSVTSQVAILTVVPFSGPPILGEDRMRDDDDDSLPDAWELAFFGSTSTADGGPDGDADGDGVSNYREFVAGSSAVDGLSCDRVGIYSAGNRERITFRALEASGPGYDGLHRYYSLLCCTDLQKGVWQPVPGYDFIPGCDQEIQYTIDGQAACYYRTRVWLE